MKNLKKLLFTALLLLCSTVAFAQDFEVYGICYKVTDAVNKTVEVSRNVNGYSGNIVIPGSVTWDGVVYRVTRIGNDAFNQTDIENIELPNSIEEIG